MESQGRLFNLIKKYFEDNTTLKLVNEVQKQYHMKNKILALILILAFTFFAYSIVKGYMMKYDIEKNGKISVGQFVSQDNYGKGQLNYFIFYINGERYKANGGRSPEGFSKNIGQFYKILYSEKYNGHIKALFNEQVTDTVAILKAGFSIKGNTTKIIRNYK